MLEKAKEVTRTGKYIHLEYARFADDRGLGGWVQKMAMVG